MDAIRTFIAIELPPEITGRIGEIQTRLKTVVPQNVVRWVKSDGIHLTLKFLGQTPDDQIEMITTTLKSAAAAHSKFALEISGAGCFPDLLHPHIIWIGVHEDRAAKHLSALQHSIESAVAPLGYPTERREFSPHLTLGRVARDMRPPDLRKIGEAVSGMAVGLVGRFEVSEVALIKSDLQPHGAVYTIIARAPLKL